MTNLTDAENQGEFENETPITFNSDSSTSSNADKGKITGVTKDQMTEGYDISNLKSNKRYWAKVTANLGNVESTPAAAAASGWTYPEIPVESSFVLSNTVTSISTTMITVPVANVGEASTKYRIFYTSQNNSFTGVVNYEVPTGSDASTGFVELGDSGHTYATAVQVFGGTLTKAITESGTYYFAIYAVGSEASDSKLGKVLKVITGSTFTFATPVIHDGTNADKLAKGGAA